MQIGLLLPNVTALAGESVARNCVALAGRAERLGFDAVWLGDHVVAPAEVDLRFPYAVGPQLGADCEIDDPLVLLSALAQTTERLQIGVCALAIPYRHPLVTAKMLSTADQLAGGRVVLGAATGWAAAEFAALGLPESFFDRRGDVTDDYLRAIKEAWLNTGPSWYQGEFVRFSDIGTFPHPIRAPHIPIWAAGRGATVYKRAARLGSGLLLPPCTVEQAREAVAALAGCARRDRRDPAELTVAAVVEVALSSTGPDQAETVVSGSAEQIAAGLSAYEQAGVQHVIVRLQPDAAGSWETTAAEVEAFAARVLPALQGSAAR